MIETTLFYLMSGLMLSAALAVVVARQPIYSVLSLLAAMSCLAALFILLGAYFVAALQLLLYVGAVLVLFVFVVMLLNLEPEVLARMRPFTLRGLGIVVAVLLGAQLIGLFLTTAGPGQLPPIPEQAGRIESLGKLLFRRFLLPFELTSFLILAALIGAITLARSKDSS